MGAAGAGKTTVGRALADRLGRTSLDADALHAPDAVARMARGEGLTDEERAPWLDRVAARMAEVQTSGAPLVLACSALRQAHRDRLRAADPAARFVWLDAPPDVLAARLAARTGHYAGPALLTSQLAALEEPTGEPDVVRLDARRPPADLVESVARALGDGRAG